MAIGHYSDIYIYCAIKYHDPSCSSVLENTMNAEDIFKCSIRCEIMLMIKAWMRLIFSTYNCTKQNRIENIRAAHLVFKAYQNSMKNHNYHWNI